MLQQLVVVTYGNGDIVREIFNAVAASMGDSPYKTLLHLTLTLAGTWMVLQMITKRSLMVGVHWVGLYFLAFYVLFLPKATVTIIDRVQQSKVYSVDNVPLGLAILASYTTVIGDSLTQQVEKNFSMPNDLRYGQTGMLMASNLVTAAGSFQITDPVFQENMQDFINQCVFYDLLLNKYSAQDLLTAPNIWQFVTQNASPARAFMYNHSVVTCKDGVVSLNQDWKTAIDAAGDRYGARLFPNDTQAKVQLLKYLPLSYNYLTNLSDNASNLLQQNMMANALQNRVLGWSARSNAPAALESFAFNKAQQQTRIGNRTVGDLAAYWLPLMKNLFEGILYGSFVFIFLLLLFPFGGMVLLNYLYSLLWVQLWAPLYAIINLYVSFYAQYRSLGAIALGSGTTGLSLSTQSGLAQVNADMSSLAGYVSLSVPIIASSLVYGFHRGFAQVAQYVGGSLHSGAGSVAAEAASGNLSLGNTSFGTHTANNTSANHFDTTARTATGMITNQMPGGSTLTMTQDGSMVMNNQGAISNLGTTVNLASAIRSTAMEQADTAYSAALSHQQAYSEAMSDAKRYAYDLSQQEAKSESNAQGYSTSVSSGETTALNSLDQQSTTLTHGHGATESASKITTESGSVGAHTGVSGRLGLGLGAGASASAGLSANASINLSHAHSEAEQRSYAQSEASLQNTGHARNVDTVLRDVQEGNYRTNTEEGRRLVENISASLDRAHQEQTQAAAQFQQTESYRQVASIAEENAVSINSNATQEFMTTMQHSGAGMRGIEQTMVNHPEQAQAQAMAEAFTHSKAQAFIQDFAHQSNASQASITHRDQENTQKLQSQQKLNAPQANYQTDHAKIAAEARTEGLVRDKLVDRSLRTRSDQKIKQRTQEIEDNKNHVMEEKNKLTQKVEKNKQDLRNATGLLWTEINKIKEDENS